LATCDVTGTPKPHSKRERSEGEMGHIKRQGQLAESEQNRKKNQSRKKREVLNSKRRRQNSKY